MKGTEIHHIFLSDGSNETRALKEMRAAARHWPEVTVGFLGLWEDDLTESEEWGERLYLRRFKVGSRALPKGPLLQVAKFVEWAVRIAAFSVRRRPALLHCHSLVALPVGVLIKALTGAPLVYDAHELETEQSSSKGWRRHLQRWTERFFIRFADRVMVVGGRIGQWYENAYGLTNVLVVRNIPDVKAGAPDIDVPLRQRIGAGPDDLVFLYLGNMGNARGIEVMTEAFATLPVDRHMVFVGYGTMAAHARDMAATHPNIHVLDPIPSDQVVALARGADVGMSLETSRSLSNVYALPNKLFEYLTAGLPVAVTKGHVEKEDLVRDGQCGWIVDAIPQAVNEFVRSLDRAAIVALRPGAEAVAAATRWANEEAKMLDAYTQLMSRRSPRPESGISG